MNLETVTFGSLPLDAAFFDSLREDYPGFDAWFRRKAAEPAMISRDSSSSEIAGFLYLKVEEGPLTDIAPERPSARRLKVGTLKVTPHGTRLGERLVKKIFDRAAAEHVDEIYVTVFPKHTALIELFERYGFRDIGTKPGANGVAERVLARPLRHASSDPLVQYPGITRGSRCWLLGIYPEWHTKLFPDSKLHTEGPDIVRDVSHTNSIHKIYVCAMGDTSKVQRGDTLAIYRTNDGLGPAHYRSVVTSICVVEDCRDVRTWSSADAFAEECEKYSVFTADELRGFWKTRRYPTVLRFSYNLALPRRPTRGALIDQGVVRANDYAGFCSLSWASLEKILELASADAAVVVDSP